jgi:phosphoribosylamine-glycine ligase
VGETTYASIANATVRVPDNIAYRSFAAETVVLNLDTGKYHGLNTTGGRMLEVLDRAATVRDAVRQLADEYGRPIEEIEVDVAEFCADLAERQLVRVNVGAPS